MGSSVTTETVKNDLCIGCGACAALCPAKTLQMKWNRYGEYTPVEIAPCDRGCGLCLAVCPFAEHDDNEDTIGKGLYGSLPGIAHRPETGYYLSAYAGYADEALRAIGASGGMATWLLERLHEEGIVDHTICVASNNDPDRLFSFRVFSSSEEVRKGAGSAYYPVEMSEVIRYILETPGKYAVIGLPCFIKAIRLAQGQNKKLDERVIVTLGLVCGQLKNRYYTDYIAALAQVHGRVKMVKYRGKSPDHTASDFYYAFKDESDKETRIFWADGISRAWGNRWFTPKACNYCDDIFAECADVTFMDAWLPEYSKDGRGTSLILVRSPVAAQIIDNGVHAHRIFMDHIPVDRVVESQAGVIATKRDHLAYWLYLNRKSESKVPRKRVMPTRPKNPFLCREIVLKKQMQMLSRDLWNPEEPDLKHFIEGMQPYLRQRNEGLVLKVVKLPFSMIKQKFLRSRNE